MICLIEVNAFSGRTSLTMISANIQPLQFFCDFCIVQYFSIGDPLLEILIRWHIRRTEGVHDVACKNKSTLHYGILTFQRFNRWHLRTFARMIKLRFDSTCHRLDTNLTLTSHINDRSGSQCESSFTDHHNIPSTSWWSIDNQALWEIWNENVRWKEKKIWKKTITDQTWWPRAA